MTEIDLRPHKQTIARIEEILPWMQETMSLCGWLVERVPELMSEIERLRALQSGNSTDESLKGYDDYQKWHGRRR